MCTSLGQGKYYLINMCVPKYFVSLRTSFYVIYLRFDSRFHCKQCFNFVSSYDSDKKKSYTCIYAFQDYTLRVANASHITISDHKEEGRTIHDAFTKHHSVTTCDLSINSGCFIIFDGAFIHGGTPYVSGSSACYRLHFYIAPSDEDLETALYTYSNNEKCSGVCEKCDIIKKDKFMNFLCDGKWF